MWGTELIRLWNQRLLAHGGKELIEEWVTGFGWIHGDKCERKIWIQGQENM